MGIFRSAITFATVKVLPEPVTPRRTWSRTPDLIPCLRDSMASGWSPEGLKLDFNVNCMTYYCSMVSGFVPRGRDEVFSV